MSPSEQKGKGDVLSEDDFVESLRRRSASAARSTSWIWLIVAAGYIAAVAWAFFLFVRTIKALPEATRWMGIGFAVGVIFGLMNVLFVAFLGMMIHFWLKTRKEKRLSDLLIKYYDFARSARMESPSKQA